MSNDTEKTIRPADADTDAEKTMRPQIETEAEKTMRPPADVDAEKTMRPSAEAEKTMRPDSASADKTMRPDDQQQEKDKIVNQQFTEFELNKVKYQVINIISEGTGEAQIFLVENKGKQFALKLYYAGIASPRDIMDIIRKSTGTGLLVDTYDNGVWTNPLNQENRDYELMEYCAGGMLDKFDIKGDENKLGEIALRAATALNSLHKKLIIHRDVKPENFFFRKAGQHIEDLALADFGIAIKSDANGKAIIDFQLRTKTYAAPEFYDMADGKIQISIKSDFYSLGMMLLILLNGKEISKLGEFELINMKKHGKLPYPQHVGERTLQLLKALTLPDPNARAGFEEVSRWAKGENIYNLKSEKDDIRQFKIVYNPTKKQTAQSPEELAKFMFEDQELAGKYLYSGKINQWLTDNLRPDLAIDIETFVEKTYPKDPEAGLMASCYRLDEDMPYYDVKNKALSSPEEIAKSLKENFKQYSKTLGNKNDSLFLFFNARGLANVTNEFAKLFKKSADNRDALLQLIHTLDQQLPWIVVSYDNKTTIECWKPEDVIKARYSYGMNDQSWNDLIGEGFLTWLRYTEPAIEGKVRSASGSKQRQSAVLYNLSSKVAYNYQMDEAAGDYFFTAADVGDYMNIRMQEYIKDEKNSVASEQLSMMLNIDNTRLWDYFKSKGVYDDKIDWIKYCADLKSKDNTKKAGPYNWQIAIYKAIKGLGFEPYYYFAKSNKKVSTLAELNAIPSKELKDELKNSSGYLQAWLTTFYQENPSLDLRKKYTFEKATIKYLEHLEQIDPQHTDVVNYKIGENAVSKALAKVKRQLRFHRLSKWIAGPLVLIASVFIIFNLLSMHIPIDIDDHYEWVYALAVIIGIIGFAVMYFVNNQGCLINAIVGAIVFGIVFAFLYFLIPFTGYIAVALLVIVLIWMLVACYIKYPSMSKAHKHLFSPTFEECSLEPLHFAFSNDQHFKSSISDASYGYADYLRDGTKKFYKFLIMPVVLIVGMAFLISWASTLPDKLDEEATTATVTANSLNLRSAANSSARVVKGLKKGEVLTVTGEAKNGWIPVKHKGSAGYVSTDYVSIEGDLPAGKAETTTTESKTSSNSTTTKSKVQAEPKQEVSKAASEDAAAKPQQSKKYILDPRPQVKRNGNDMNLYIDRVNIENGRFYIFFTGSASGNGGDGDYAPFWNNQNAIKLINLDNLSQTWTPVGRGEDEKYTKVTTGFYLIFEGVTGTQFSLEGASNYVFEKIEIK